MQGQETNIEEFGRTLKSIHEAEEKRLIIYRSKSVVSYP